MAQSTITIRIDEQDKADFDAFCTAVGLNTSAALMLFIKTVLRENAIPFKIALSPPAHQWQPATDQDTATAADALIDEHHALFKALADK